MASFTRVAAGSGYSYAYNSTWSTVRGFADGLDTQSNVDFITESSLTTLYEIVRGFTNFDTSSLDDSAAIQSAVIKITGIVSHNVNSDTLHIVAGTQASLSTLANADFDQAGATSFGSIALSAITDSVEFSISLNASGIAHINKTGSTKFAFRLGTDLDNSTPTGRNRFYLTGESLTLEVTTPQVNFNYAFFM